LDGILHLPTAESYYGGIPLEIYDVGASGNQMTFSVRFSWKLDTGYVGENHLDACSIDFDQDGKNEIFYPMDDGNLFMWKDETLVEGFPISSVGSIDSYAVDGGTIYFATPIDGNDYPPTIRSLRNGQITPGGADIADHGMWKTPIMIVGDSLYAGMAYYGDMHSSTNNIVIINKTTYHSTWIPYLNEIVANLSSFRGKIYAVSKSIPREKYDLYALTTGVNSTDEYPLDISTDSTIVAMSIAPFSPSSEGEILVQTPYSVYLTDLTGHLKEGYPISLPFPSYSQVTITDTDKNGTLDYLVSGENSFAVYDYAGRNMLTNFNGFAQADTLGITSGVLAGNLDGDGKTEYIGAFSRNRLAVFEDNLRLKSGYPVSFSERSRNLPFIHMASDSIVYAWLPTDNGRIFRTPLPESALNGIDPNWFCKYGNLERTSSRERGNLDNQFETSSLFVPGETYVFPNPVRSIYEQKITFNIMTSRDATVEVSVFDISGNLLHRQKVLCEAYLHNRGLVDFPVDQLSSGVYIVVMKSGNDVKRLKFAVEK
jgi:hypothetical protein